MKLTKYQHACFTVELDNQLLVVDPGNLTEDFLIPDHVAAIVITHEHDDHFDPDTIQRIMAENADAVVVAHESITAQLPGLPAQSVTPGDMIAIGPFNLEFFGGEHAAIDPKHAPLPNIGVLINETLYYPGDSFTLPHKPVEALALPVTAPWLKIIEAVEFLTAIKPEFAFPTHDAIASDAGKRIVDSNIVALAPEIPYRRLDSTVEL